MSQGPYEHRLRFGPTDREQSYYRYISFEVPPAWPSLKVSYSFDRARAAIDLGLLGPGGFRGWSGGARSSASVARTWATPGYLPGELAGQWSVMLGLYRLPPEGVEVSLSIGPGSPSEPPPPPLPEAPREVPLLQRPPARPGYRWVAGDLHCHSEHSDGALSLAALAALAKSRGLDFLAITDHNTVSHFPHLGPLSLRYGLSVVPGQEVTTPYGHANAFGPLGWVDFRSPAPAWLKQARDAGGLLSINHPVMPSLSWQLDLEAPPDLVELWHQSWDRQSPGPLEFWASSAGPDGRPPDAGALRWGGGSRPSAKAPRRPVPVGGSDFHRYEEADGTGAPRLPGNPTTWLEVPAGDGPPAVGEVLEALRRGAVAISATPSGPTLVRLGEEWVVSAGEGASLAWLAGPPWSPSGAEHLGTAGGGRSSFRAPTSEPALALLVDGEGTVLALCP